MDSTKPSPRFPWEVMYRIIAFSIPRSTNTSGHDKFSIRGLLLASKALRQETQKSLVKDGAWALFLDLRYFKITSDAPPPWMSHNITNLSIDIMIEEMDFDAEQIEAFDALIKKTRAACPHLTRLLVTFRPAEFDASRSMMHRTSSGFWKILTIMVYSLPRTILHRSLRLLPASFDDGEPTEVVDKENDEAIVAAALGKNPYTVVNIIPRDGQWKELCI